MQPNIRQARLEDLDQIVAVLESSRTFLGAQGLPQWQNGYGPSRDTAQEQVEDGRGYVVTVDGAICGYAELVVGAAGAADLVDATWPSPYGEDYVTIHSVAIDASVRGRGIGKWMIHALINEAAAQNLHDIRIDTHPGNHVMQRVIAVAGFTHQGVCQLDIPDGERLAYQLILPKG